MPGADTPGSVVASAAHTQCGQAPAPGVVDGGLGVVWCYGRSDGAPVGGVGHCDDVLDRQSDVGFVHGERVDGEGDVRDW